MLEKRRDRKKLFGSYCNLRPIVEAHVILNPNITVVRYTAEYVGQSEVAVRVISAHI